MSDLTVLILAAGLGTRMKSERPKVLHEILGRPMICPVVDLALALRPRQIAVVVGHSRDSLRAELHERYPSAPLLFAIQEEQLGTGHAVSCALEQVGPTPAWILVLYGDVPNLRLDTVQRLYRETDSEGGLAGFLTARRVDPTGYGRVVRDDQERVIAVIEHEDATKTQRRIQEVNAGTYLFRSDFLLDRIGHLSTDNRSKELYLTDLIADAAALGQHATAVCVEDPEEAAGINTRVDLARAHAYAVEQRNLALMRDGVTLIDPTRVYVEIDVQLASDVILWPGVILRGCTRVERGVEIGPGVIVRDSTIQEDARILAYSHLEGAAVGARAQVGPFARLRPGTDLQEQVRIGNFVEVKKSLIGPGTKANHLTYLGDAVIGERVNIGAGTITCNYDGRTKHTTTIQDEAFIGSNTELIAPVTVGSGAVVGAGTTVTQDVPARALAISRVSQHNFENYADRRRKGDGST